MKSFSIFVINVFSALVLTCGACDNSKRDDALEVLAPIDLSAWDEEKISHEELVNWQLLGQGNVFSIMNGQTCLAESDETQGVTLLSPKYYEGDVAIRYKMLALTDATIFVVMLSATDTVGRKLTVPVDHDGGMGFWTDDVTNYFFAFRNAPHGGNPFVAKNPKLLNMVEAADQDYMLAGVYYDIEIGRKNQDLWLSVNGKKVVSMQDETPIHGGHIALRLRGTAGMKAVGLIRELKIYTDSRPASN